MRYLLAYYAVAAVFPSVTINPTTKTADTFPLVNAHAHNDYQHEHPLFDALAQGYASIEADICLIDGTVYVAHNKNEV